MNAHAYPARLVVAMRPYLTRRAAVPVFCRVSLFVSGVLGASPGLTASLMEMGLSVVAAYPLAVVLCAIGMWWIISEAIKRI
ncbi:hypothetical protein [Nisaea sediminum]|uniref:hypothetical protein n=1 Tax=Nisaea sediminum TaxID=2775867 RepID=UPI0018685EED|nr:hypothetical protein [Nisaea sediminum]